MQGPKKSRDKQARELRTKIVERTGISNSKALEIALDAIRGRDLPALARQKGWPVNWDRIVGPSGELPLSLVVA